MLPLPRLRLLAAGALLTSFMLAGRAPVAAQVSVTPDTVAVSLAAGETTEVTLTVSNAGADTSFAVSLAPALSEGTLPEPPGTVLFTSDDIEIPLNTLTSTPDGRLFISVPAAEVLEFTPELTFVREFDHPRTTGPASTVGMTYDADRETLWFLDSQSDDGVVEQVVLLESDLDGEATGHTLPVTWDEDPYCTYFSGFPADLAYDAVTTATMTGGTGHFYYLDIAYDAVWAMDSTGQTVEGYPYRMTDYPGRPQPFNGDGCVLSAGLDAHALGGEPVLESLGGYPFQHPRNRPYTVVVTGREGRSRGAETPLYDLEPPDGFGRVNRLNDVVRSRLDPSVLYVISRTGFGGTAGRDYVYAVRAAPLPPVWLHASPILFEAGQEGETEVEAGTEITLTLDASELEPGVYEGVASVREGDGIGSVVAEVPVTMAVAPVDAEEEPQEPEGFTLGEPYPNPAARSATTSVTVPVVLAEAAEVRVAVFDVLGREVSVLHEGSLGAGGHQFRFEGRGLPAGGYVVRAESETSTATEQITIVR